MLGGLGCVSPPLAQPAAVPILAHRIPLPDFNPSSLLSASGLTAALWGGESCIMSTYVPLRMKIDYKMPSAIYLVCLFLAGLAWSAGRSSCRYDQKFLRVSCYWSFQAFNFSYGKGIVVRKIKPLIWAYQSHDRVLFWLCEVGIGRSPETFLTGPA